MFTSFSVFPGITALKSFVFCVKYTLLSANLNPSTATMFNLLFSVSIKQPVNIGLLSSVLTAKIVLFIMFFNVFCSMFY